MAIDLTGIQRNDDRYWLFAAVDADTNRLLPMSLFPTRTQPLTDLFHDELREKHLVNDAIIPSMERHDCRRGCIATGSDSSMKHLGSETVSNVFSER